MKKLVVLVLAIAVSVTAMAQHYTESVYLKNGSIVKGVIEEQIPGESLKIRTADGSLFVYSMDQVEKITKERAVASVMYGVEDMDYAGVRPSWASTSATLDVSRFNDLSFDGQRLTTDEVKDLLGPTYYGTFTSAYRQIKAGRTLLSVGLAGLGLTALCFVAAATSDNEDDMASFSGLAISCGAIADLGICLGCIFSGVGRGRRNWVVDSYNEDWKNGSRLASVDIEPALFRCEAVGPGYAGNLGVGAALRVRF